MDILSSITEITDNKKLKAIITAAQTQIEVNLKTNLDLLCHVVLGSAAPKEIKLVAVAAKHKVLGIVPEIDRLGYLLDDHYRALQSRDYPPEFLSYLDALSTFFSISDYVFNHTHYDCCADGRFHRMS